MPFTIWIPPTLSRNPNIQSFEGHVYHKSLKEHIASLWTAHKAIIFVMATGAVVRLIAPLLQDKATDPAILVMNDGGNTVISLCGGHQQRADQLTQTLALHLNATAVVTGASHQLGFIGVDMLGTPFGWTKGQGNWTGVSGAIARQEPVQVIQEAGTDYWQYHLPDSHSFQFGWPEYSVQAKEEQPEATARLWISPTKRQFAEHEGIPKAQWHPRVLWVGVGCERGTSRLVIEQGIQQVCQAAHFAEGAIAGIATIDLKADEIGLVDLCGDRQWPLRCFNAEVLKSVTVPTPSAIVQQEVGTPSVAEASALLAATIPMTSLDNSVDHPKNSDQADTNVDQPIQQSNFDAVHLPVSKQIFRIEGQPGAVTIAIAQAPQEYTGRTGHLWLVGTGPGQLDQMTTAAQGAIAQADAVIGYSLYIDLVKPLLRPGQIVEALPITQERQRAQRAIELADWGLTVAVISSGDAGIYGMAGLVMEQLSHLCWNGQTPEVTVFPGVSALQAAAARTGAPLMHDFCTVSLSDLLTPWAVIEQRLEAAAQADFVIALYNPKSKTRTEQIAIAQSIFLKYKSPQTPVAIVHSAYRAYEQITLSTLDTFLEIPIDMLTVILIGNASTQQHHDWLITPRGYLSHVSLT